MQAIRYNAEVYITSDKIELDARIIIRSPVPLPAIQTEMDCPAIIKALGCKTELPPQADDWRLMTDAEVEEYRAGEEE